MPILGRGILGTAAENKIGTESNSWWFRLEKNGELPEQAQPDEVQTHKDR
jgi:hypothetical protein